MTDYESPHAESLIPNPQSLPPTNPQSLIPNPFWYACLYQPAASSSLIALAEEFSPRYQVHGHDVVIVDISGLERLFGEPQQIGEAMHRSAVERGLRMQIAIAATRTAARILAMTRPGLTVIARGDEPHVLARIPLGVLTKVCDVSQSSTFTRWGLQTLGDLAALPADELAARVGQQGLMWQRIARGQDVTPLVPALAAERFAASIDLEWPIEGLEPLSFVLTRLLEPLSTRLERHDRGAAALHVTLGLLVVPDVQQRSAKPLGERDARRAGQAIPPLPPSYVRSLQLPAPIRDVRTLRTLILLDLESHPPAAPIERVSIVIDPTPGRVLQHALFSRAHPTPEQLSTLIARLNALMGEDRVGRPQIVDSYRPGAFAMQPFGVDQDRGRGGDQDRGRRGTSAASIRVMSALRRCRRPVPARVSVVAGRPAAVTTDRRGFAGGRVIASAGPWRTSGHWWEQSPVDSRQSTVTGRQSTVRTRLTTDDRRLMTQWNCDEWDVWLGDGAVYRIFQDRVTEAWFIDAIVD